MPALRLTDAVAVRQAVGEFDARGREDFLAAYGFARATGFFLRIGDRLYDSKAIAGRAWGIENGTERLPPSVFSGGEGTVKQQLGALGFTVIEMREEVELPTLALGQRVFVEVTKAGNKLPGGAWELGAALWSPTRNRTGADRYKVMREPRVGDVVIHFVEETEGSWITGRSWVARPYRELDDEPPLPGPWAGREAYYRIELSGYRDFRSPVSLNAFMDAYAGEVRTELARDRPRHFPFSRRRSGIRTVQGVYLAEMTRRLYRLVAESLEIELATESALGAGPGQQAVSLDAHREYAEARRAVAERQHFARNPALVRAAKEFYGTRCSVCEFDFGGTYGDRGEGYIECHHLNPLGEREEADVTRTTVADVAVVCANCHRMIHRTRPAMRVEELRQIVRGR